MIIQIFRPPNDGETLQECKLGDISDALSLEYEPYFCGVGTFTLELPVTSPFADVIAENILLWCREDDFCLIVKSVKRTDEQKLTVKGYDLNGMLLDRITMERKTDIAGTEGKDPFKGTTEACVKHYVEFNMISSDDAARNIPRLAAAPDLGRGIAEDSALPAYECLEDVVRTLCEGAGMGYRIRLVPTSSSLDPIFVFDVAERVDRSAEQNERNRVIFSVGRRNITSIERETGIAAEKNALWCETGGMDGFVFRSDDENGEPVIPVSWNRREEYISLSVTDSYDEEEIKLFARKEMADKFAQTDSLTIDAGDPLDYGRLYRLGDIVTVWDKARSVQLDSHISAAAVKRTATEHSVKLTLGESKPKKLDGYAKQTDILKKNQRDFPAAAQNSSHLTLTVVSGEAAELSQLVSVPLSVGFEVTGSGSHTVFAGNQCIDAASAGTLTSVYVVDGAELDHRQVQELSEGRQVVTHIVPMDVLAGSHTLLIRQTSDTACGITEAGGVRGVLGGQLAAVSVEAPPNYSFIFKYTVGEGEELTVPALTYSAAFTGQIYWGDGSSGDYTSTLAYSHTYESAGDYRVVITAPITVIDISNSTIGLFYNVTNLREVVLSDDLTEIGDGNYGAFQGCTALTSVKFGSSLRVIRGNAFYGTALAGTLTLPENLTEMGLRAFYNTRITALRVDCPSLISVGQYVFGDCTSLVSVYWNAPAVGSYTFRGCAALKRATLGDNCTKACEFALCEALEELIMSDSITSIVDTGAYVYCRSLRTVKLSDNITKLPEDTFGRCTALNSIELPSKLTSIGDSAFFQSGLMSVVIPDGVKSIGSTAFSDTPLTSAVIPPSVKSIGQMAFNDTKLTSVTIASDCTYYANSFPSGCTVNFYD